MVGPDTSTTEPHCSTSGDSSNVKNLWLAPPINFKRILVALFSLVLGGIAIRMGASLSAANGSNYPLLLLGGFLFVVMAVILALTSGFGNYFSNKEAIDTYNSLLKRGDIALNFSEKVERAVFYWHEDTECAILLFTSQRMLIYYLDFNKCTRIEQICYTDIFNIIPLTNDRFSPLHCLQIQLRSEDAPRPFYHHNVEVLRRLSEEFHLRQGRPSTAKTSVDLCRTCHQPLSEGYCATCGTRLSADRRAMWLAIIFPGIGQFYNRDYQKGCIIIALFAFGLAGIYHYSYQWLDNKTLSPREWYRFVSATLFAITIYALSIADAYKSSIHGRKPV